MRKDVMQELADYENTILMIHDKAALEQELNSINPNRYNKAIVLTSISTFLGTLISLIGAEESIRHYISENNINAGSFTVMVTGIILGSFALNDYLKLKNEKYIDSEKKEIIKRQIHSNRKYK